MKTKDAGIRTERELKSKLRALGKMDDETRNSVVCSLIGHSRIQTTCFGYYYCGRCETQVGDNLGSIYNDSGVVVVGHNCETCRDQYETLTWRDKMFVADPFAKATT